VPPALVIEELTTNDVVPDGASQTVLFGSSLGLIATGAPPLTKTAVANTVSWSVGAVLSIVSQP